MTIAPFPAYQAAAQRFIYDLESSCFYAAADETPAHKAWAQVHANGEPPWPSYTYGDFVEGHPLAVLERRWQLPSAWGDQIDAAYEAGTPEVCTPEAWAAFLQMPLAMYQSLVDLVLDGRSTQVWALADGTAEADTALDPVEQVLALARTLPVHGQMEVLHQLSAGLQVYWQAARAEATAREQDTHANAPSTL